MKHICFILLLALIVSCQSTQKLYEKGDYTKAYYSALGDLKKNNADVNAKQILADAYSQSAAKYEADIANAKNNRALVYNSYRALQAMYEAYNEASFTAGAFSPKDYSTELSQAAENAAAYSYNKGISLLQHGDRISARKAYDNLQQADSYVPGYKDVIEKKQEAYVLAITNVIVNKLDQRFGYYNINGAFFENDLLWNLNSIGKNNYYIFYNINDSRASNIRVDQYMDINMYDIWFSNLATNTYSYNVSKSVPVKNDKLPNSTSNVTVTATVYVTRRIINSRAVMDYRITDAKSQRIISSNRIPAQYTWESLTGRYTGDSRALGDKDWAIIRGVYNNRPSYDDLYRELTRQMMNQFTFSMRSIYR
ncbi:MAG: hypothetical protein J0I41_13185 [Filimonas sp.]|nr:hypothetical protein [Filimonas sp.]